MTISEQDDQNRAYLSW